ncbi:MAG: hypothetical protein ACFFD4_02565 [Candidatus Odinarchaeota archaeon]
MKSFSYKLSAATFLMNCIVLALFVLLTSELDFLSIIFVLELVFIIFLAVKVSRMKCSGCSERFVKRTDFLEQAFFLLMSIFYAFIIIQEMV